MKHKKNLYIYFSLALVLFGCGSSFTADSSRGLPPGIELPQDENRDVFRQTAAHCVVRNHFYENQRVAGSVHGEPLLIFTNPDPLVPLDPNRSFVRFNILLNGSSFDNIPPGSPRQFNIARILVLQNDKMDAAIVELLPARNTTTRNDVSAGDVWDFFDTYTQEDLPTGPELDGGLPFYLAGFGNFPARFSQQNRQSMPPLPDFNGNLMQIDRSGGCTLTKYCSKYFSAGAPILRYNCDMAPGNSGGPVVDQDNPRTAIGINVSENSEYNSFSNIAFLRSYENWREAFEMVRMDRMMPPTTP